MKKIYLLSLVLLSIQTAHAQRVFQLGADLEVSEWGGLSFSSLEDNFGADADALVPSIQLAIENSNADSFRFTTDITNSCADASNNMIDGIRSNNLLPEGSSVKQIGTLGSLTTAENDVFNTYDSYDKWWNKGQDLEFPDYNFNPLDPPSYAHTLSLIELANGNFYTIDNWKSGGTSATVKRVYPIDEDGVFFSTNPNETDINNSEFRIQKTDRGLCPNGNCEDPVDKPEEDSEVSPNQPTSETTDVEVLTSADPNDKLGLRGVGTERYIKPGRLMEYLIRFENMPDASAPAQEVLVRDTLDVDSYDLSTFELGDITFSDQRINVPEGLRRFNTRVPVLDGEFDLLIDANMVSETGIVTWKFTTLDPETNDLPFDPLDGFLPPNQTAPEGEGSVAFSVKAFEELSDGHAIRNEARIIFDLNEPIDTPVWGNVIDITAPSSQVEQFTSSQGTRAFDISWSGSDGGAGISTYDIYLAVNDGPFLFWQKSTPATEGRFVGQPDSTYSFFSIAYDAVGNSEPIKTEADASTSITVSTEEGVADLPMQYELFQNYPNPFNPSTVINYALPEASDVTIRIYDVMGRRIATLLNEKQTAGWHNVTWNAGSVASGTYFYRIQAGNFAAVKKLTLIK